MIKVRLSCEANPAVMTKIREAIEHELGDSKYRISVDHEFYSHVFGEMPEEKRERLASKIEGLINMQWEEGKACIQDYNVIMVKKSHLAQLLHGRPLLLDKEGLIEGKDIAICVADTEREMLQYFRTDGDGKGACHFPRLALSKEPKIQISLKY